MLGRPPNAISVADVIEAIDGPFTVTACSTEKHDCEQFSKCSIRDPLWQIRERIAAALATVTIAEIAAENLSPVSVSHAAVMHNART
jgi:DNA-binding IscR family transcriptional regulator